ncbi:ArsR family transcriptional regulator [Paenibacillaceae bacterium]|nr:ArsR family transcriptional regulator [Paenibacillaceae bacterium]
MQSIRVSSANIEFLECLSSNTRIKMIELLNDKEMNIGELAAVMGISSAIVTKHIQKLERAGIVSCESVTGKRGIQKVCKIELDAVTLEFKPGKPVPQNMYAASIPIGHFTAYDVKPTCGMCSELKVIGMNDDPRYFADPEHVQARHLWFGSGFIEYRLPNYLLGNQVLRELDITLEIASEAPGYNENWPSDITFMINGKKLGIWTSPGDFGSKPGMLTPAWHSGSKHGLLKKLSVTDTGTFMDGVRISGVTVDELGITFGKEVAFRIECEDTADNCGGVTLYGRGFGNYDQDIEVRMYY